MNHIRLCANDNGIAGGRSRAANGLDPPDFQPIGDANSATVGALNKEPNGNWASSAGVDSGDHPHCNLGQDSRQCLFDLAVGAVRISGADPKIPQR